uniref:Uncharacterized protein n=1 Tax=Panagrolaimus superbus TaxID=310955 RepID=A0A914Y6T3_9BILA
MLQYFYLSILFISVLPELVQAGPDDLFILLDEISVFGCRGVQNEVRLREEDVNIVNEKGNKVYYIRAPGNYSLHFGNIKVLKNLGHLTGEIGVTLQVPVLEGPAGNYNNFKLSL